MFAAIAAAALSVVAESPSQPLTKVQDAYPAMSPDGRTLLFQSTRNGRWALYVAKPDGSEPKLLLDSGDDPVTPSWSPDARRIAFAATVAGQSEIFVMAADGTDRRRLTDDPGDDAHPHWSADGRIFFNSARTTPDRTADWSRQWHEVFSMRADGSDLRQHSRCRTVCTFPSASPDGRSIAYRKVVDGPGRNWDQSEGKRNSEVFVADIDGANERNLSDHPAFDGWPVWSPDSRRIAFASSRDGVKNVGQVYLVPAGGGAPRRVTEGPWSNVQPSFTPDGKAVLTYRHVEGADFEYGHVASTPVAAAG